MHELSSFEFCVEAINDALDLVDVKSGQIYDLKSNQQYLSEIIEIMSELSTVDIKRFYKSFKKAFEEQQLLTHLVWAAPLVSSWRKKANLHWGPILANEAEVLIALIYN